MAWMIKNCRPWAVLVQLSYRSERTRENRVHRLARLYNEMKGSPVSVEFRHRSWSDDWLFVCGACKAPPCPGDGYAGVSALFSTHAIVTNPSLFYVWLHGRMLTGFAQGSYKNSSITNKALRNCSSRASSSSPKCPKRHVLVRNLSTTKSAYAAPRNATLFSEQLAGQSELTI